MAQARTRLINAIVRRVMKRRLSACKTPLDVRRLFEASPLLITPKGARYAQATMGGVPGEWIEADKPQPRATLLYLHGGGYVSMSPRTHRPITAAFARRGLRVFAADYRLAPEHPFPAALDDATAAWRALRAEVGGPMLVAGDSAGGGLALAMMLNLRDRGERGPDAGCLFSPWTDLACTGESTKGNRDRDPLLTIDGADILSSAYAGGSDLQNPLISPLYGDFAGLPRMIAFVGDTEVLLDDSIRVAARAKWVGVDVELRVYPDMPHVWPALNAILPEGRQALEEAVAFLLAASATPTG